MPAALPDRLIENAEAAITFAEGVRRFHRRRTSRGSAQRDKDIEVALERLKLAMKPLKSEIGRFQYGPQTDLAEANREKIRDASRRIQAERRKLWKMK